MGAQFVGKKFFGQAVRAAIEGAAATGGQKFGAGDTARL
jgi:hypothetical protein